MTPLSRPLSPLEIDATDAAASMLMKRGIRLVTEATAEGLTEALDCFDRAIELRRGLPVQTVPALRYGLAACWLNRADGLMRLGGAARVALALAAYDEALALLQNLPLDEDARFPRRLAIAYQNRGLALMAQGSDAAAIAAFSNALAVLDHERSARIADRAYLLGAVLMNLANVLVANGTADSDSQARDAAHRAMTLVKDLESRDADAADVGLKARHILCRTLARRLPRAPADGEAISDDVHDTTDLVDEGLEFVRQWEQRNVARFRHIACDLLRFGVRVYATCQPHFVHEFVLENIDPNRSSRDYVESTEIDSAAREGLARMRR